MSDETASDAPATDAAAMNAPGRAAPAKPLIRALRKDADLLADILTTPASSDDVHLWWLGQSGYVLRHKHDLAAIDPYLSDSLTDKYASTDKPHVRMTERVMPPEFLVHAGVRVVTASHQHTDHLDMDTLTPLLDAAPWVHIVAPEAWRQLAAERALVAPDDIIGMNDGTTETIGGFTFTGVASAHEQLETDDQGRHKYLGYVIRAGRWTIYHSGDTMLYDGMAEKLRPHKIDIALLPINGRAPERKVAGNLSGKEAAWLAKEIGARVVIPNHYDMFEFNTASPQEFVAECERLGQRCKVLRAGERFSSSELSEK